MSWRSYETRDGLKVGGQSYREVAERLRRRSNSNSASLAEFMREVAGRMVVVDSRVRVRCDAPANFVEDLVAAGFLRRGPLDERKKLR
jgi:hypothetical protein